MKKLILIIVFILSFICFTGCAGVISCDPYFQIEVRNGDEIVNDTGNFFWGIVEDYDKHHRVEHHYVKNSTYHCYIEGEETVKFVIAHRYEAEYYRKEVLQPKIIKDEDGNEHTVFVHAHWEYHITAIY